MFYEHNNHINKSLNLPYTELLEDGCLKSDKELAKVFLAHDVDTLRKCTIFCQEPLSYGSFVIDLALTIIGGQNNHKIFPGGWSLYKTVEEPNYEMAGGYNLSATQHFDQILARQDKAT